MIIIMKRHDLNIIIRSHFRLSLRGDMAHPLREARDGKLYTEEEFKDYYVVSRSLPQSTGATELSQEAMLLESTGTSANIVFVNIDWKESRHHSALPRNMALLHETITDIVHKMNPTVICMCEVGGTSIPLSEEQMQQVAEECISSWQHAATEHGRPGDTPTIRSMYATGFPYMTLYVERPAYHFSGHRVLQGLYHAGGEARTAQTFVMHGPGDESIDVINVHAPSGKKKKLTESQRLTLLTNLLQSNSLAQPGSTIGKVPFLIGGDMNTPPLQMSQILKSCRANGSLRTSSRTHEPDYARHGDLCITGSIQANTIRTTAKNHDPMHDPYGICWTMQDVAGDTYPPAQTPQTPWPCQHTVPGSVWNDPAPVPPPGLPTQVRLESEHEQGDGQLEEASLQELEEGAAASAAVAATEHSEETPTLPVEGRGICVTS